MTKILLSIAALACLTSCGEPTIDGSSGSGPSADSGNSSGDIAAISPDDDKKKMPDSGNSSGGGNSSPNAPPSNLNDYPYALLVPDKKGYVTLPGAGADIGQIDVTGIEPGTPVEINDPRDASKMIYFRVPDEAHSPRN